MARPSHLSEKAWEKVKKLRHMNDEERSAYFRQMDEELEAWTMKMSRKCKRKRAQEPEQTAGDFEKMLEDLGNHPAFMKEIDWSKPLHPLTEGLMELKYNSEDAKEKAENYKEEGNRLFKASDYRLAVENYTEGIKAKSAEKLLNAVLYTNRAAAHARLGNYRSAINNCAIARKFVPEHMKAIHRGAVCCQELKKHEECIKWCDVGLALDPENETLSDIRSSAEKHKKTEERDRRKELAEERKEQEGEGKLLDAIKSRGVRLAGIAECEESSRLDPLLLTSLESHHPSGAKVCVDEQGVLHWPVLLLYPEHEQTDFIESFAENHMFVDHLNHMFNEEVEPPPWDRSRQYVPDKIEVYFEDKEKEKLYPVKKDSTLSEILRHKRYIVHAGTPAFVIIVSGSKFREAFLKRYQR